MISGTRTFRRVTCRGFFYLALLAIANAFGCFDMWQSSACWAQQTVTVYPGQSLQALVNQYPQGTTFSLTSGEYRLQSVQPQSYDSFVGQPGAVVSGAALLTNFWQSGSYWVSWAQVSQQASYPGQCEAATPACIYPEDLFFNSSPKQRVNSLSAVGPGTWYLDYSTGDVYMGDNPNGYTVEISELPYAFYGGATSVTISNLIVEKYACLAQAGAIDGSGGSNYWSIDSNEVRYNHGTGIRTGTGMFVNGNNVHNNGQLGVGGGGNSVLITSNQIYYNNFAGYSYYWEAGGSKLANVQDLTFEYNSTYGNYGPGFWVDINSQNVTVNGNQFNSNTEAAILSEISNNVTISSNYIWNDGYNPDGTGIWYGAGILISDSTNVSVYFNSVANCMDGIGGILSSRGDGPDGQPYTLQNVNVNSNWVTQYTGYAAGIVIEGSGYDNSVYTSWNNQFQSNTWYLGNQNGAYFYWMGYPMTLAQYGATLVAETVPTGTILTAFPNSNSPTRRAGPDASSGTYALSVPPVI